MNTAEEPQRNSCAAEEQIWNTNVVRTLRLWHDNLRRTRHSLEALGYDQAFFRLWEFYLCYCEGGFLERSIGTAQLLLAKPAARPAPFGLSA
ncbi:MAG: hypothetical protein B7Z23_09430 [Pseudomonadales bacterium 32-61-5]|nr:MAG: hypothetical protein B7Z23_09430 [Pseudomonadales bacterium 32-61-5]